MSTHAFRHEKRRKLTDQQFARIFLDCGGMCHICKRRLRSGDKYQIDHILALENGGTDTEDNMAPCCDWCHRAKTAKDHSHAAKGRAVAVAQCVPTDQRRKKGRPLMGSKRSGWRKRFDGTVERRS